MMTDFKAGDDAWYYMFPEDGCGGHDVEAIELVVRKNLTTPELTHGYLCDAYKSKHEAISAMGSKLEQLKKEDNHGR